MNPQRQQQHTIPRLTAIRRKYFELFSSPKMVIFYPQWSTKHSWNASRIGTAPYVIAILHTQLLTKQGLHTSRLWTARHNTVSFCTLLSKKQGLNTSKIKTTQDINRAHPATNSDMNVLRTVTVFKTPTPCCEALYHALKALPSDINLLKDIPLA